MKVICISPFYPNIWENLNFGLLAAYCQKNYKGKLDFEFYHGNFDDENTIIKQAAAADIAAFSCTTPTFKNGFELAKKIKSLNKNIRIVFGGWHTTCTTEWHQDEYEGVIDQIVVGEGERAFLDILNGNKDRLIFGKPDIEFSDLPWPDRTLIQQTRTLDLCFQMCGERIMSLQSRRGCPFSCKMCGEHCMSNHNVRVRDPEDTLNEIEAVDKEYNISKFKTVDPTWCYPKSAASAFCEEKLRRNNLLPWECMVHTSFLTKDLLKLMKRANCVQMNIGVESGSQQLLNDMGKGVTVEKIRKVFEWGKEIGIERRAFFLLGMPNETECTVEETRQLVRAIDPDVFGMTILCPYPGSSFYDSEKHKDVDWSKADEYSNDFWETKNFSNEELKEIQKGFAEEFKDKVPWHQRFIMERNNEEVGS